MQRLIEFLFEYKDHLLLILFITLSVLFLSGNDSDSIRFLRARSINLFSGFQLQTAKLQSFFSAPQQVEELTRQNLELSQEVYELRTALIDNIRLRRQLRLNETVNFESFPAKIIQKSLFQSNNYFLVNTGKNDGISTHQVVRSHNGLVGRITLVGEHYSQVQLMISKNFKLAVKVLRSNTDGILTWDGKSQAHVNLSNVVQTADVVTGDQIVTSPLSTFAPEGIPIGYVDSIRTDPTEIFKWIRIKNYASLEQLSYVYVVRPAQPDSALLNLQKSAEPLLP